MSGTWPRQDVADRLRELPRPVVVLLAARAALRVLPLIGGVTRSDRTTRSGSDRRLSTVAISVFRANAVGWVAGTGRPAPRAAARAAADAARAAAAVALAADAARAVAAAAAARAVAADAVAAVAVAADAVAAAAAAARAADARAADAVRQAFDDDMSFVNELDHTLAADRLAQRPLWPSGQPGWATSAWDGLEADLLRQDPSWQVWTTWYEDRILAPGSSPDPALEDIIQVLPDDFWDRPPAEVNADLLSRASAIRTARLPPPEPIPGPGPGPHAELGPDGRIRAAPATDFDADGNNIRRIRQLLPPVRQAAEDLANALVGTNAFADLARDLEAYRKAIAGEPETIEWGLVWGLGVTVEATADAVARDQPSRLRDALEDNAHAALETLRTRHAALIMATADGREMQEEADRLRMTRETQADLKRNAQAVTGELDRAKDIREPEVAATASQAASSIGEGPHPERGTVFGMATIKNLSIVILGAGTATAAIAGVGAFSGAAAPTVTPAATLAAYEVLKNTPMFKNACAALGADIHDLAHSGIQGLTTVRDRLAPFRSFVIRTGVPLREIARLMPRGQWMLRYIDFIVRTNGQSGDGAKPSG